MGYAPRRKLDTAKYPAITPERIARANAQTERIVSPQVALAYRLYCESMDHYGFDVAQWHELSRDTKELYARLAQTAMKWRQA